MVVHPIIINFPSSGMKACSKVYRHNGGKHELKCLSEEVGDLQAMINLLTEAGYVDLKRADKKRVSREKKHRRIN